MRRIRKTVHPVNPTMSPENCRYRGRLGLFLKLPKCLQQAIPVRYVQPPHFFEVS